MSFFSRFHKAGTTTAISQQDIKVKTVKVPPPPSPSINSPSSPLPIIAHQRSATTPRSSSSSALDKSGNSRSSRLSPTEYSTKNGLLSPPTDRGRVGDSKNGGGGGGGRGSREPPDISRSRSLKRKESSSSFVRMDSPSTSSMRSVSPGTDSVTSAPKKRRLTPTAPSSKVKARSKSKNSTSATNVAGYSTPSSVAAADAVASSPSASSSAKGNRVVSRSGGVNKAYNSPEDDDYHNAHNNNNDDSASQDDDNSDSESDSDSEADSQDGGDITKRSASRAEKRRRLREAEELGITKRVYLNPSSFRPIRMSFVHAEQVAGLGRDGYRRVFPASSKLLEISLSYPTMPLCERYQIVQHRDSDEFNPIGDIIATIEMVAEYLLTPKERIPITTDDPTHDGGGILRMIRRSVKRNEPELLVSAVEKYNKLIRAYRKTGIFQHNIERMASSGTGILLPFAEHILSQSYARSVAVEVDALRKYEAFSNNVYGELLPRFTSKLFKEARLRADQVFVDLGSGTGNVVLHAALEVGCESWGCEVMEKACELADAQAREFEARCVLWGIKPGKVTLKKGDFLENDAIAEVLRRADVLLVNNYAFDSTLNARLIDMFLDLKEGTQIISLKSFVPPNHVITPRNVDSPVNLLRVEEKEYFSGCVSWTNAPGRYYVAMVDRSMIREFLEKRGDAYS